MAADLKPYVKVGKIAPFYISAYPNAGLPNQLGEYDETPEKMALQIEEFINEGLVNIIGGCCGTTLLILQSIPVWLRVVHPIGDHFACLLAAIGFGVAGGFPQINFLNIGERCNVAGSRKFLRLIKEKKYESSGYCPQAGGRWRTGTDINMDDGLLDGVEMTNFLNLLASDPDVSRVPIMIDSSIGEF